MHLHVEKTQENTVEATKLDLISIFGLNLDFTGIDSPYEAPLHPDGTMRTSTTSIEDCTQQLVNLLVDHVKINIILPEVSC